MRHSQVIDELAQRLAALMPVTGGETQVELECGVRRVLQGGLHELDLVRRAEYDVQRCVLLRTREKLEEVEQRVLALERALGTALAQRN